MHADVAGPVTHSCSSRDSTVHCWATIHHPIDKPRDVSDHHGYEHHSTMISQPSGPATTTTTSSADRNNKFRSSQHALPGRVVHSDLHHVILMISPLPCTIIGTRNARTTYSLVVSTHKKNSSSIVKKDECHL